MAFLERNLEQLTQVQRQLVEQNSALKKEVAIAERKLIARNERIQSLESLLQESQEKMAQANHKYAPPPLVSLLTTPDTNHSAFQIRSPTRRRQRPARGRQGRQHARPGLAHGPRRVQHRQPHRQAAPRRRLRGLVLPAPHRRQPAEPARE